ncbi:GNAT family N-acetyltransferase [Okibacterium endophyticum]
MAVTIRTANSSDFFIWLDLFVAYGDFYNSPVTDQKALVVWNWIETGEHTVRAALAEEDGKLVGFAHYRTFARPLAAGTGLYIDDLFVAEEARGGGVATALIEHVKSVAQAEKAQIVRWVTAPDNEVAQLVYDSMATRTEWITYDMTVAD